MTKAEVNAAVSNMEAQEKIDLLGVIFDGLKLILGSMVDDALRAIADFLTGIAGDQKGIVSVILIFVSQLLRFAASKV